MLLSSSGVHLTLATTDFGDDVTVTLGRAVTRERDAVTVQQVTVLHVPHSLDGGMHNSNTC